MTKFWYNHLEKGKGWDALWHNYIICGECQGITKGEGRCEVCDDDMTISSVQYVEGEERREFEVYKVSMGAEGRYEDYVYLRTLEKEWHRPLTDYDRLIVASPDQSPAAKAIIVLVFWTYFETRIARLLNQAMIELPDSIRKNLLNRYQSISSRTGELYKDLFGSGLTYFLDLEKLGFEDVAILLKSVQKKRNEFMHGKPEAIDDDLVEEVVRILQREHEGWIHVFNLRIAQSK